MAQCVIAVNSPLYSFHLFYFELISYHKIFCFSCFLVLKIANFLCTILQVIAFSDEEGVRFQSTFLGSAAIAGILPVSALQVHDKKFVWLTQKLVFVRIATVSQYTNVQVFQWCDSARCSESKFYRDYRRKPFAAQI